MSSNSYWRKEIDFKKISYFFTKKHTTHQLMECLQNMLNICTSQNSNYSDLAKVEFSKELNSIGISWEHKTS